MAHFKRFLLVVSSQLLSWNSGSSRCRARCKDKSSGRRESATRPKTRLDPCSKYRSDQRTPGFCFRPFLSLLELARTSAVVHHIRTVLPAGEIRALKRKRPPIHQFGAFLIKYCHLASAGMGQCIYDSHPSRSSGRAIKRFDLLL